MKKQVFLHIALMATLLLWSVSCSPKNDSYEIISTKLLSRNNLVILKTAPLGKPIATSPAVIWITASGECTAVLTGKTEIKLRETTDTSMEITGTVVVISSEETLPEPLKQTIVDKLDIKTGKFVVCAGVKAGIGPKPFDDKKYALQPMAGLAATGETHEIEYRNGPSSEHPQKVTVTVYKDIMLNFDAKEVAK